MQSMPLDVQSMPLALRIFALRHCTSRSSFRHITSLPCRPNCGGANIF